MDRLKPMTTMTPQDEINVTQTLLKEAARRLGDLTQQRQRIVELIATTPETPSEAERMARLRKGLEDIQKTLRALGPQLSAARAEFTTMVLFRAKSKPLAGNPQEN